MGVNEIDQFLDQCETDAKDLHGRIMPAATPGSGIAGVPFGSWPKHTTHPPRQALEQDLHTIGRWASTSVEGNPSAIILEQSGILRSWRSAEYEVKGTGYPAGPFEGLWKKEVRQFLLALSMTYIAPYLCDPHPDKLKGANCGPVSQTRVCDTTVSSM